MTAEILLTQQLVNHCMDSTKNFTRIYFLQSGHELIRFSGSWVWRSRADTETSSGGGDLPIDGLLSASIWFSPYYFTYVDVVWMIRRLYSPLVSLLTYRSNSRQCCCVVFKTVTRRSWLLDAGQLTRYSGKPIDFQHLSQFLLISVTMLIIHKGSKPSQQCFPVICCGWFCCSHVLMFSIVYVLPYMQIATVKCQMIISILPSRGGSQSVQIKTENMSLMLRKTAEKMKNKTQPDRVTYKYNHRKTTIIIDVRDWPECIATIVVSQL